MCFLFFQRLNDGTGGEKQGWVLMVKDVHQLEVENAAAHYTENWRQELDYQRQLVERVVMNTFDCSHNEAIFYIPEQRH